jgi:hypothetical protein
VVRSGRAEHGDHASQRRVVSHHWHDWANEVVWMSLYFSVAVWLSIALVHAPLPARNGEPAAQRRRGPAIFARRTIQITH